MKQKLITILFVFLVLLVYPRGVFAVYNPTSVANNKVGMHIIDTSDLNEVAKLVNSKNGDWGYVTLVIQKGERNPKRWQTAFDEMRRLHLIPIVRIATASLNGTGVWEKPSVDEIDGWVTFLNSLNWVTKNRYVTIGNEVNHANEWGAEVNPAEYGSYLKIFSEKLKKSNENFFILPAGFDASAPTARNLSIAGATMDEALYLQKMIEADKDVFNFVDGWSSHSYPNPAFSGPGDGSGKGTVGTFGWELNYLKSLGVEKDLPVFITETGWVHEIDNLSTDIGIKIETAFNNVWGDKRVVAVTPFVFRYTHPPFDNFSWLNEKGEYYDFYYNVLNLEKIKGDPVQEENGDILTGIIPKIAMSASTYHGVFFIKNTGQSIWQINKLGVIDGAGNRLTITSIVPDRVEPGLIGVFLVEGKFPSATGTQGMGISLTSNSKIISRSFNEDVILIPNFPSLLEVLEYVRLIVSRKIGLSV